jgi:hypothetical protein
MLCFVTNKKEKAVNAVTQFKEVSNNEKILVVAPDEIINEIPCDYKAPEKAFKENHPETVFQGAYGGNRNVALAACHALKTNAIFFDDDVTPVNDPVKKHLQLLQENPAVFGKYVGQAAGTLSCLLKLVQEYAKEDPDPEKIKQYSSNIPEETRTPRTGIVGGNTAVRLDAIPKQCFYPTSYRVEDALYYGLASHYGFECLDTFEAIVEHEKTGRAGDLAKALENEVTGGSIARCISELTSNKQGPEKAVEIKQKCFDAAWEYYSVEYAQKKLPENEYTQAIHEIKPEKLLLPDEEFTAETKKFFDAQNEWRPALQKVRAEEFKC